MGDGERRSEAENRYLGARARGEMGRVRTRREACRHRSLARCEKFVYGSVERGPLRNFAAWHRCWPYMNMQTRQLSRKLGWVVLQKVEGRRTQPDTTSCYTTQHTTTQHMIVKLIERWWHVVSPTTREAPQPSGDKTAQRRRRFLSLVLRAQKLVAARTTRGRT